MREKYHFADLVVFAGILFLGSGEAAHLFGLFLDKTVQECLSVFGLTLLVIVLLTGVLTGIWVKRRPHDTGREEFTKYQYWLSAVFLLIVSLQVLFVVQFSMPYRKNDIMVETVQSFLKSNAIYRVNPMTGLPFTAGMPSRIKILALPTLYSMICLATGVEAELLVWRIVPVIVLFLSYIAFYSIACTLYEKNRTRKDTFMVMTAILLWVGCYTYGMDGFGILFAGWQGTTIRNLILVPFTISLSLRRKYFLTLACIVAEACITWTLYGMGVCLVVAVGIFLAGLFMNGIHSGKDGLNE